MRAFLISLAIILAAHVGSARAESPWVLDATFAGPGYNASIMLLYTYPEFNQRKGRAIAKAPDGKYIVAAEMVRRSDGYVMIGLAELSPNGNQTAWGDDGHPTYTLYDPFTSLSKIAHIMDIALSPSGDRIYVLAESDLVGGKRGFDLYVFSRSGTHLSTSVAWFERNGYYSHDYPSRLVVSTTGKVIAVGTIDIGAGRTAIGLARFRADGAPDSTFGTAGKVVVNYQGAYCNNQCSSTANDIALEPSLFIGGEPGLYVVGSIRNPGIVPTDTNWLISRLRSTGTPNVAFDGDGFQFIGFQRGGSNNDVARTVVTRGVRRGLTLSQEVYVAGNFSTTYSEGMHALMVTASGASGSWGGFNLGGCNGPGIVCRTSGNTVIGGMAIAGDRVAVVGRQQEYSVFGDLSGAKFSAVRPVAGAAPPTEAAAYDRFDRPYMRESEAPFDVIGDGANRFTLVGAAWISGSTTELYPAVARIVPSATPATSAQLDE